MKYIVFQISWVRRRDWHILTSGMFTYTNDERFQVLHSEGSDDWTLQIKYVQKRDNGTYECQVSVGVLPNDVTNSVLKNQSVINIACLNESHRCTVHFVKSLQLFTKKCTYITFIQKILKHSDMFRSFQIIIREFRRSLLKLLHVHD